MRHLSSQSLFTNPLARSNRSKVTSLPEEISSLKPNTSISTLTYATMIKTNCVYGHQGQPPRPAAKRKRVGYWKPYLNYALASYLVVSIESYHARPAAPALNIILLIVIVLDLLALLGAYSFYLTQIKKDGF